MNLGEVVGHLHNARPLAFVTFVVLATLAFPLRTLRWRYLLLLDGEPLPFVPLWHATAIGFMANNLLPARAGELARAYAARQLTAVRFTTAAGSIAVERLADGLTLAALFAVSAVAGGFTAETTIGGLTFGEIMSGVGLLFFAALIVAVVTVHQPRLTVAIGTRVLGTVLPDRWTRRTDTIMYGVLEGLQVLRSWRRFGAVMMLSLVVWGVNGASFWMCSVAFGLENPWTSALLLQSLIAFGIAVPTSPGFFGPFEAVTRATLGLYGTPPALAISYAVGYHISTFIPITLLGLWSLSRAHLHLVDLRSAEAGDPGTPPAAELTPSPGVPGGGGPES